MKKIFFIVVLCCTAVITTSAQNVYKEILKISKDGAANRSKTLDERRIYQFKVDELTYMMMKTKELMPDSSMLMIDRQAYAMYDFINSYMKTINNCDKKKKTIQAINTVYQNASLNNPRFNDADKELILSYYNREDYVTRFSLDTDWIKAITEARKNISLIYK